MADSQPTIRPPFDDLDADIVLRSVDDVDFHVYKVILAKASPVFRDMFTLPDTKAGTMKEGLPVVHLQESADTLETLLRICYPVERPALVALADDEQIDEASLALKAAKKYDILPAIHTLTQQLEAILDSTSAEYHALHIYAVAYLLEMPSLVRKAARRVIGAKRWLTTSANPSAAPPPDNLHAGMPPGYHILTGEAVYTLAQYRYACLEAAIEALANALAESLTPKESRYHPRVIRGAYQECWYECKSCATGEPLQEVTRAMERRGMGWETTTRRPTLWWSIYMWRVREDLKVAVSEHVATNSTLIAAILKEAEKCSTCGPRALKGLGPFSLGLEDRIKKAIDKVQLKLPAFVDPVLSPGSG
ncbi:hypothetical protein FKP32DRAFT_266974 [Trametes sanguinea]|nr:hypothetical protein FKP32DRAFT_266974 [Trametes sanguinea]